MPLILLPATLATAAACGLLALWLAIRVGRTRQATGILLGDQGNETMVCRMRAQANFVENAPFVLILLALVEAARGTSVALWLVGLVFVVARILHPFGMDGWRPGRAIGTMVTMLILLGLSLYAAWVAMTPVPPMGPMPVVPTG